MKKILIGALMMITSYGAQSQNLIDVDVEQTPTQYETQMIEMVQDTTPKFHHPLPPHARIHPPMMRGNFPKPEQIIRKGNKVILIFDRKEFDKIRRWDLQRNRKKLGTRTESLKRVEHNSMQRGYLERKPNVDKRY